MADLFVRDPDYECDNCGSDAPLIWTEWGPPYTKVHATPKQPLCRYCYTVSDMDAPEVRHLAQMFNTLEAALKSPPTQRDGSE